MPAQQDMTCVLSNLIGRDGSIKAELTVISAQRVVVRYATVALGVDTYHGRLWYRKEYNKMRQLLVIAFYFLVSRFIWPNYIPYCLISTRTVLQDNVSCQHV